MFGTSHLFKLVAAIAVAASIGALGARTAHAEAFITDTLGGNGHAYNRAAYVPGGSSQQVGQAIQSFGKAPVPSPAPVQSAQDGSLLRWSNAWIGGVWVAGLLLLAGAAAARTRQRRLALA